MVDTLKKQALSDQDVVIVSAKRTPMGSFQGALSTVKASQLGSIAIKGALQATSLLESDVKEVILGCVLSAGLGQAPARQAAIGAGIKPSTSCTTLNKVCGSGMKVIMTACDQIRLNNDHIIVAGGMESMTNAPYLLDRARSGYRLGHSELLDHMLLDGLADPYHSSRLMGAFAEDTASYFQFKRQDQDDYAMESWRRAQTALEEGLFDEEIVHVDLGEGKSRVHLYQDETPSKVKPEKIPHLKPAFHPQGTVTAANSSSIADGAAAVILMTAREARQRGFMPLAVIRGYSSHAQEPEWFTTAPIGAVEKLLQKLQWSLSDIDLFEINEAFAVVTMAALKKLDISHDKVNVWGGATTLGHPIGASGARILVTLLHALKQRQLSKGIAAVCIGGGEATAIGVELVKAS